MGRPRNSVPTLTRHKQTGQARVRIGGRDFYLGKFGSKEARLAYARLIEEVDAVGQSAVEAAAAVANEPNGVTVAELCLAFVEHAERTYVKDGKPTSTLHQLTTPLRVLRELYGLIPATEFGPLKLEAVRNRLVNLTRENKAGKSVQVTLSRTVVNRYVNLIVKVFRWGASRQIVPVTVVQALECLDPIRAGRSTAPENEPVRPVDADVVTRTLPFLNPILRDMVRLQLASGMRPGEVCSIRPGDIDRTGDVWCYRPASHKLVHKEKSRAVFLGPKAQDILRKRLLRPADSFCFSPLEAVDAFRQARHESRKTPLHQGNRPGTNRKRKPLRKAGERYATNTYARAIRRAAQKAGVPHWHPNQLRHTFATRLRQSSGLEAVQAALGHATMDTSQIYAEKQELLARDAARKLG